MYDILSIFIGKWFLGAIGWCVRESYFSLLPKLGVKVKKRNARSAFSDVIDFDEYQNRITGFKVVLVLIVIIQIF
ncbi:hypothetical protein D3C87_92710 [compost metagenome]